MAVFGADCGIFAGACCRFFHRGRGSCHRDGSRRSYGNGASLSFGSCGRLVLRSRLQQLPYLDEDDHVDDDDDDAGNVMAEECERNDKLGVLRRYEVTVVLFSAMDAVVDDRVHGNGEHQQPITLNAIMLESLTLCCVYEYLWILLNLPCNRK